MNVPDSIRIWTEQAQYDLGTAQAMMRSRRYLYVLFCCQQAVEKTLKAIIVQTTGDFPPRVHQLMRLVEAAKLQPAEDEADFLRELSAYYIQTRYPEEIRDLASHTTHEAAVRILHKTKETIRWLESMLRR